jgi:hypothetical protein
MRRTGLRALAAALLVAAACEAPPRGMAGGSGFERIPDAELAPVAARVSAARGEPFAHSVAGWRVPQSRLRALLARELDLSTSRAELSRETQLAEALGLLPSGFDLRSSLLAFQTANAAAFYSARDDQLYVVAGSRSAATEDDDALRVHELTHALQAQRGPAPQALLGLAGDDDLAFALSALLEGEATFVELADAAARGSGPPPTPAELAARFSAEAGASDLPRAVAETMIAPYPLGYALAHALAERGGTAALDAAQRDPPLTSEELLHPELYLRGPREPFVELPREPKLRACRATFSTCYGELQVRAWLEQLGASEAEAASAAAGWDADRAYRLACGSRAASAWLLVYRDAAEASELERTLLELAPALARLGIEVERSGARLLVSRGLGRERAALLGLPVAGTLHSFAEYLSAHPEVARRARR